MPSFTLRQVAHQSPAYDAEIILRERVLRAPLGLSFSEAELKAESVDWHLGAFAGTSDTLIGCLVLSPEPGDVAKMRQVAVAENHRGLGIGRALVTFAEKFSAANGISRLKLHARDEVVPFYESMGYEVTGDPFVEVTIPHQAMTKSLRKNPVS